MDNTRHAQFIAAAILAAKSRTERDRLCALAGKRGLASEVMRLVCPSLAAPVARRVGR